MKHVRVLNATKGSVLGAEVQVAESRWARLRGLLGRPVLKPGEGLLLVRCRGVHTYGMRCGLDVLFLDGVGSVVRVYPGLMPGQLTPWHRGVRYALELPVGTLAATGTEVGDRVIWVPLMADERAGAVDPAQPVPGPRSRPRQVRA